MSDNWADSPPSSPRSGSPNRPRSPPPSRSPTRAPPVPPSAPPPNRPVSVSRGPPGARPPPPNRKPTTPIPNITTNNNDYKEESDLSYDLTNRSSEISEVNPMTNQVYNRQIEKEPSNRNNNNNEDDKDIDNDIESYGPMDYTLEFGEDEDYNEYESEAMQMIDKKHNYPNPTGLSKTTRKFIETPKEFLTRILSPDEKIICQFDVVFPTYEPSLRQKILWNLITLGFYSVYRHPSITMTRGKLVITSTGRAIHYKSELSQNASCLDFNQINYLTNQSLQISNCKDICETAIIYSDSWLGRLTSCSCCRMYRAGIDVTFNGFNHNRNFDDWQPKSTYLSTIPNLLYQLFIYRYLSIPRSSFGLSQGDKNPLVMRIVSGPKDKVFDGVSREPIEDLLTFHIFLNDLIKTFQPKQTFLPVSASDKEVQSQQSTTRYYGVKDINQDIEDYEPINSNGVDIAISNKWLSLCDDEQFIGAVGQTYQTTLLDTILSICTIGLYYFFVIKAYKKYRHVTVLTTRRLASIYLIDSSNQGRVPQSFSNFKIYIHSIFPKYIQSGYILGRRKGDKTIQSYLQSAYGSIYLSVPFTHLSFLQKLHLTTSRIDSLELDKYIDNSIDRWINRSIDIEYMPYLPIFNDEKIICYFKGGKDYKPINPFSYLSTYLLKCLSTILSNNRIGFCGFNSYFSTYLSYYPSNLSYKHCIALIIRYISCGYLPISYQPTLLITNHTIIYLSTSFRDLAMYQAIGPIDRLQKPFFMLWFPIRSFQDYSVCITAEGSHPIGQSFGCCCIRSPRQNKSDYHIYLLNSLSIPITLNGSIESDIYDKIIKTNDNKIDRKNDNKPDIKLINWLRNKQLRELQLIFSSIQSLVNKDDIV